MNKWFYHATVDLILLSLMAVPFASSAKDSNSNKGISIEQAYQAVPHRRTGYDASRSEQPAEVRDYLSSLFEATDQALVQRISGLNDEFDKQLYLKAVSELKSIQAHPKATDAHRLIVEAVVEQMTYLEASDRNRTLVQSSHKKLVSAHQLLMRELPESLYNQRAYFDHLCALDFI